MQEFRTIGKYRMIKKLTKGGQGSIWKVINKENQLETVQNSPGVSIELPRKTPRLFSDDALDLESTSENIAMKRINHRENPDSRKSFEREAAYRKILTHKNLTEILDIIDAKETTYVFYKYYPLDLLKYLKKSPKNRIPENTAKNWILQIIEAMAYLNSNSLMHRDLKPENILLSENSENAIIKICDFGLIRDPNSDACLGDGSIVSRLSYVGTLQYAAPEVIKQKNYSFNCDVWSLGVIAHLLLYGKYPMVKKREVQFPEMKDDSEVQVSENARDFIRTCLVLDRKKRPEFKQLKNHSFLEFSESECRKRIKICSDVTNSSSTISSCLDITSCV